MNLHGTQQGQPLVADLDQDGLWDWQVAAGAWRMDAPLRQILGFADDAEIIDWVAQVHPDDQPRLRTALRDHLDGRTAAFRCEHRLRRRDGGWQWVLDRGRVVERSVDGTALRMVGTCAALDGQAIAQAAVEPSDDRFGAFMEHAPMLGWSTTSDGRLAWCNQTWADHNRLDPATAIGRRLADLMPPARMEIWRRNDQRVVESGQAIEGVETGPRRDGSPGDLLVCKFPLPGVDGQPLIGGIGIDITERRHLEEELRTAKLVAESAVTARDAFLATMSHELRTPMNAIIGYAELLLAGPLAAEQRERAGTICRSADALLRIINDILDYAKICAGRMELERVPFDLSEVVHEVVDLFRPRLLGGPVEMVVRIDPLLPGRLIGDPGRLRQILVNLVGNAVKFTARGWIGIDITLVRAAGGRAALLCRVTDTGPGIPAELRPHLFAPFTQAGPGIARRHGGTGLGLSITRRLVELMGGSISAGGEPGRGAIFTAGLTFGIEDAARPEPVLAGRRILVVDPLLASRRAISETLRAAGAAVDTLGDAEAALRVLALQPGAFQAILMDPRTGVPERVVAAAGPTPLTWLGTRPEGARQAFLPKPARPRDLLAAMLGRTVRRDDMAMDQVLAPLPAMRVLVAEDNHVNRELAIAMLTGLGCHPVAVADGQQAVDAVLREPFDAVLMDCQMPGLDGFAATECIRRSEIGTGRHVPIIAVSADTLPADRQRCRVAGMDEHVAKPMHQAVLHACLARWAPARPPGQGASGVHDSLDLLPGTVAAFRSMGYEPATFLTHLQTDVESALESAAQALVDDSLPDLARAVHAVKGSCLNVGAYGTAGIATRLQEAAQRGDDVDYGRAVADLERRMRHLVAEVRARIAPS